VSLRDGSSELTARPRTPHRGPGPPAPSGPPFTVRRSGDATCPGGTGAGSCASPPQGGLAHPPHLMRMVDACSAAAVRGTAFDRPRCAPHITKVHSAAACAAPAQSPSAALNGYDGTTLFHHAAYAASYTARLSYVAGDATSYVRFRPDKTAPGHDGRRAPGAGKESRREISIACNT